MRQLLILITSALLTINCYSQDTTFHIVDNGEVVWKKIFPTTFTFNELLFNIKKTGLFSNIDTSFNSILGEIKRTPIDYSNAKETIWKSDIPLYIKMSDITATFEINYKLGKYQVVIRNIKCVGKLDNPQNSFLFLKPNESESLSVYALKNNKKELTKSFLKYSMPIFDFTFTKFFLTKESKQSDF